MKKGSTIEVLSADKKELLDSSDLMHLNFFKKNACCGKCKGEGPCYTTVNSLSSRKINGK